MARIVTSSEMVCCSRCDGLGEVPIGPDLDGFEWVECPRCHGDGRVTREEDEE